MKKEEINNYINILNKALKNNSKNERILLNSINILFNYKTELERNDYYETK